MGGVSYDVVSLPDGEDWLWAPVAAGMCRAESLLDGTLDMEAVAAMNDVLAVRAENGRRAEEARTRASRP